MFLVLVVLGSLHFLSSLGQLVSSSGIDIGDISVGFSTRDSHLDLAKVVLRILSGLFVAAVSAAEAEV